MTPFFSTYNNITEMNIGSNDIASKIDNFLGSIKNNINLKRLSLCSNSLANYELKLVSLFLKENTTLEYLDLSFNKFDEIGFINFYFLFFLLFFFFLFFDFIFYFFLFFHFFIFFIFFFFGFCFYLIFLLFFFFW